MAADYLSSALIEIRSISMINEYEHDNDVALAVTRRLNGGHRPVRRDDEDAD